MGGLCSKKAKTVKVHELAFMGIMTEGARDNEELINKVY